MSKYKTVSGWFFVNIEKPTADQIKKYYDSTGEIQSSTKSASSAMEFKKVTILNTFDEEKYPVDSVWMMGEAQGLKINFFGEKITAIQEKDLYARIF